MLWMSCPLLRRQDPAFIKQPAPKACKSRTGSNGNKNGRLLRLDPIVDPCGNGLLCTAPDDGIPEKRMNSALMDFYVLFCTPRSNLKIRFFLNGG
jgi:hypothetical protein